MKPTAEHTQRHDDAWRRLRRSQGVLVPGGFGDRGIEGKVLTAGYCRSSGTPFLGICVGLQTAVIEFARSVLGHANANSTEFAAATPHPVVVNMPEISSTAMGGTMRLGSRATVIGDASSLAFRIYGGESVIHERHRHRYEVNEAYVAELEQKGLRFTGRDECGQRMEICELQSHPFFLAVQFHPEFKSRPSRPSPPFLALVLAASRKLETRLKADSGVLRSGAGFR